MLIFRKHTINPNITFQRWYFLFTVSQTKQMRTSATREGLHIKSMTERLRAELQNRYCDPGNATGGTGSTPAHSPAPSGSPPRRARWTHSRRPR